MRMLTSGESHGKSMTVTIEGYPAGVSIDRERITRELARRQRGYGRGKRMEIEQDTATVLAGIRHGQTLGSPITICIDNKDHVNWQETMSTAPGRAAQPITAPRPGHADLTGVHKYGLGDIRDVLERASARETVSRVAGGALFKTLLEQFSIRITSQTIAVGTVVATNPVRNFEEYDKSPLRCADPDAETAMIRLIDTAREQGDSLGGQCEIRARGVVPGLGSYVQFDRRLDAGIGMVMLSIPSIKGVEIGPAFENTRHTGSAVHDEIGYTKERGFYRVTNRAGGIEGGMSTGEDIVVRCAIKPIPTLAKPLATVDIYRKEKRSAQKERADTCVVPAAGVIAESMLAYVLCCALLEKFGADSVADIRSAIMAYQQRIRNA